MSAEWKLTCVNHHHGAHICIRNHLKSLEVNEDTLPSPANESKQAVYSELVLERESATITHVCHTL